MNKSLVDDVVNAVLYEGYMLYPYRPSVKNRQRWTFGGLYPRGYCEANPGSDAWSMQTECLLRGDGCVRLQVQVRFLHLLARRVGEVTTAGCEGAKELPFRLVDSLRVGDTVLQAWQEAVERSVIIPEFQVNSHLVGPQRTSFAFPASRQIETLRSAENHLLGVIVRDQQAIAGTVEIDIVPVGEGVWKVRVRIENRAEGVADGSDRDEVLLRSLVSTHTILRCSGGAWESAIDPADDVRELSKSCQNTGTWPVLVGAAGERDTLLSSPIILYDHPQVAPESPGDFFDGTEIDEILILRILTLTTEEKAAAAAVDGRVRELLRRTEALGTKQLQRLHGAVRGLHVVK